MIECRSNAYVLIEDGRFLASAGIVETVHGRMLWSVIAPDAPMIRVHRAARRLLSLIPGDIVATTRAEFAAGCRWLLMLGFKDVGRLEGYEPGHDHLLYIREAPP